MKQAPVNQETAKPLMKKRRPPGGSKPPATGPKADNQEELKEKEDQAWKLAEE